MTFQELGATKMTILVCQDQRILPYTIPTKLILGIRDIENN
jgi:hypothetical protein